MKNIFETRTKTEKALSELPQDVQSPSRTRTLQKTRSRGGSPPKEPVRCVANAVCARRFPLRCA